jgi:uncharacterized protein YegL
MSQREGRFLGAVEQLEKLVTGITPALSGLDASASSAKEATEALTSGATSIREALNENLGAKSPIHRAVKGLDLVFEKTERSLGHLTSIVKENGEFNTSSQEKLGSAIQALGQSIERIGKDHESRQSGAAKALKDFTESLNHIPASIQAAGDKAVEAGLTSVKAGVEELNGEQKKWHFAAAEDLRATTTASLAGVTKAGQDLAAQAGRVATAASDIHGIKTNIGLSLKDLTESGKSQISQIGNATKSEVEIVAAKLSVEAEKIGKYAELMDRPQRETASLAGPGKWAPTERNAPTRSVFGDNQKPFAATAPPSNTAHVFTTPEPSAVIVPASAKNQQTIKTPTESAEPSNAIHLHQETLQRSPLPSVQASDTSVGNAVGPSLQPKENWWSRITSPFSGKNS